MLGTAVWSQDVPTRMGRGGVLSEGNRTPTPLGCTVSDLSGDFVKSIVSGDCEPCDLLAPPDGGSCDLLASPGGRSCDHKGIGVRRSAGGSHDMPNLVWEHKVSLARPSGVETESCFRWSTSSGVEM